MSKLEMALQDGTPGVSKIPEAIMTQANGLLQKLSAMKKVGERINKNKASPSTFTWTTEDVHACSQQANAQAQVVSTMAKSMAALPGWAADGQDDRQVYGVAP